MKNITWQYTCFIKGGKRKIGGLYKQG
jgi:hypothetical protein